MKGGEQKLQQCNSQKSIRFTSVSRTTFIGRQTKFYIPKITMYEKNDSRMYWAKLGVSPPTPSLHVTVLFLISRCKSRCVPRRQHVHFSGEDFLSEATLCPANLLPKINVGSIQMLWVRIYKTLAKPWHRCIMARGLNYGVSSPKILA
jgi:hypothetical protein